MDAYKLRGASDLKLGRWLAAARSVLGYHDRGAEAFDDARLWARQARAAERVRLVAEIEELEAEIKRRAEIRETLPRS